ncbi:GTP cyclohydrolase I FolE [Ligilactobacillus cholophilus]|uniref:GTP cyclohydrolase I FolE n=1 Tax=Ligilactobacillus cholophilus TaxID=3050131 RepID=UPI0025B25D92|nr:GTP cyclohydrolase I FolE [Ligilactobacillus cholophilus]
MSNNKNSDNIETIITNLLESVGDDPQRPGLIETPHRVEKMYQEILGSINQTEFTDYKLFDNESVGADQDVMVTNIPFYSMCEHHMLPFFGVANVAYVPNDKIIGLSKIPRLIDFVSHRLTLQEKLTHDIALELNRILKPKGIVVQTEARHMCVEMRGVKKLNSVTKSKYYDGIYKEQPDMLNNFIMTVNSNRGSL